jgi:pimeloyl-ACP methyl ester carboxylesterase
LNVAWERKGLGSDPTVLLIHGLGYARWGWEPVVDGLARWFDVLVFDNLGIGGSDAPPGPYTVRQMADAALQVLYQAEQRTAHVVGSSLGGMIALELAISHPDVVDRLVLASTHPGGAKAQPMPQRTVELMSSGASLRAFVENALEPDPRPELVDRILEHRERTAQPFEAWAAQAAAGASFDAGDRVGEIEAPTLVQTGDGDVVVDPRNSELLAELLPDARLSVYEGCGHLFFWQEPERFVRELEKFLQ